MCSGKERRKNRICSRREKTTAVPTRCEPTFYVRCTLQERTENKTFTIRTCWRLKITFVLLERLTRCIRRRTLDERCDGDAIFPLEHQLCSSTRQKSKSTNIRQPTRYNNKRNSSYLIRLFLVRKHEFTVFVHYVS